MSDSFSYALSIVNRLVRAGYLAYFAGGWVRDYVMGHPSEDIDIATNASPAQIMDLFPGTLLVGLAFGVVIVPIEGHQFEVATFRKDVNYVDGRHPEKIELTATPQEDSFRRDFTINGMFYDPIENQILDYVHGKEDIKRRVIRTIGNPYERFFEDRLRMLRAFRFAARFSFSIDLETQEAIRETADQLFPAVALERVWQEFNKMSSYPRFDQAIVEMHRLSLLDVIFPELESIHLNDLRHFVKAYSYFPRNCPTILYLMQLFPHLSLEQKIEISKRLKVPNREIKRIEFMDQLEKAVLQEQMGIRLEPYEWAHLFASPDYPISIQVLAARLPVDQQTSFLQNYQSYEQKIAAHVKRIQEGKPLIGSQELKQLGIKPGKQMGALIKEAQKISINQDLNEKEVILSQLKKLIYGA